VVTQLAFNLDMNLYYFDDFNSKQPQRNNIKTNQKIKKNSLHQVTKLTESHE